MNIYIVFKLPDPERPHLPIHYPTYTSVSCNNIFGIPSFIGYTCPHPLHTIFPSLILVYTFIYKILYFLWIGVKSCSPPSTLHATPSKTPHPTLPEVWPVMKTYPTTRQKKCTLLKNPHTPNISMKFVGHTENAVPTSAFHSTLFTIFRMKSGLNSISSFSISASSIRRGKLFEVQFLTWHWSMLCVINLVDWTVWGVWLGGVEGEGIVLTSWWWTWRVKNECDKILRRPTTWNFWKVALTGIGA